MKLSPEQWILGWVIVGLNNLKMTWAIVITPAWIYYGIKIWVSRRYSAWPPKHHSKYVTKYSITTWNFHSLMKSITIPTLLRQNKRPFNLWPADMNPNQESPPMGGNSLLHMSEYRFQPALQLREKNRNYGSNEKICYSFEWM